MGHISQRRENLSKDLRVGETAMKTSPSRGNRRRKGPKVGDLLACSRHIKEAIASGADRIRRRVGGDEEAGGGKDVYHIARQGPS